MSVVGISAVVKLNRWMDDLEFYGSFNRITVMSDLLYWGMCELIQVLKKKPDLTWNRSRNRWIMSVYFPINKQEQRLLSCMWVDELRIYVHLNSISAMPGKWEVDNERLYAMDLS